MERGKADSDTGAPPWCGGRAPRGRAAGGRNRWPLSTDAASAGGPARSSGEAPVTGAERRGRLIRWFVTASNQAKFWEETRGQVRTGRQVVSDTEAAGVGGVQAGQGEQGCGRGGRNAMGFRVNGASGGSGS